uniref:MYB-related transcription factor n=1 Tax=Salvia miltiorrhiza TaxID=226208 RepID=A0A059PRP6_SALMI|nr:MYB-related transcription factor [Salvia miltiorrhiza]AGN52151.1 MYB-related transcription factor [Salvia miltiorrhiza]
METNKNTCSAISLPTGFSNIDLKREILDDDFGMDNLSSSKGYLQDFQDLEQLPMTASYCNWDTGIQANGFDPFASFPHGSVTDFSLYRFKPYEENGSMLSAIQDFQAGGFLNFPDRKGSSMVTKTASEYNSKPLCFVVPDESSCVTGDNFGYHNKDGSKRNKNIVNGSNSNISESLSTKKCVRAPKKSKSAKGQWTAEEDRLLIHLVEKYGLRKWSNIAQMLKGRIGKQCRERWHNHLRPDIKKDVWTLEEDRILIEVHAQVGNKWAEIAKSLPGRTENTIKNHWNATKRRQFTTRKCRTKWPRPSSLLQNYIKSLNFEKGSSKRSKNIQPPATTDHGILSNSSITTPQEMDIEFSLDDHMLQEYGIDEVQDLTFDNDSLFTESSIDMPVGLPYEFDDGQCFDAGFPLDIPPLMQCGVKQELDFHGSA